MRINSFEVIELNRRKKLFTSLLAASGIVILVLDSKTTTQACAEAIDLCIRTVIPSLFPLFVFSILLTGSLDGFSLSFLRPVSHLCAVPAKAEVLLLTSFLGGYPTGAQCVSQAYTNGTLQKSDAERLLPVCSNAGPAFIFGIAGSIFSSPAAAWLLWLIQILSAMILGWLYAEEKPIIRNAVRTDSATVTQALQKSIKAMASVCGWILLFRCLIAFLSKWLLHYFPNVVQAIIIGSLELTNGCWYIETISSEPIQFVLCAAFLSFGGLCVLMQTLAVTGGLRIRTYLSGKLLQALLSAAIATAVLPLLYECTKETMQTGILISAGTVIMIFCMKYAGKFKKTVAFTGI